MSPRKILAFAVGPIGGALLALITLPIISWLFSQEDVGKLAMLQVAIGFSTLLFSLGLDQAYVREFHEVSDPPALFKHAIVPGFLLLSLTLMILLSFGGRLASWLFDYPYWQLSVFVGIILIPTNSDDQGRTIPAVSPSAKAYGPFSVTKSKNAHYGAFAFCAEDQGRTGDLPLFRRALYQLSYLGKDLTFIRS